LETKEIFVFKKILFLIAVNMVLGVGSAGAASDAGAGIRAQDKSAAPQKAAFVPPGAVAPGKPGVNGMTPGALNAGDAELIFSAPPRESAVDGVRTYQPVAEYLSRVIGRKIVYRHPQNWLTYQTEMLKGSYDLIFDGPHFNSWRISHQQHNTLARLPDEFVFAVVVRKDENQIAEIKQLAGKKICGMNPPNLGTLTLLSQFDNPARQPVIIDNLGWAKAYEGVVLEKRCAAGILPLANLRKYDQQGTFTRIIFKSKSLPNQAFSAGPRIAREDQARIAQALLAPDADAVTAPLRAAYGADKRFVRASKEEYAGIDSYLKDIWGYAR
jgi:ABC-type phosphate/phosphonate transport system substrate-binding protein